MLQAIAIDDEPMALEVIRKFVSPVQFIELKASFLNAFDALDYLTYKKVDLLFLDVRMPDMNGIDLFRSMKDPPSVIFTTAHSEHALQGFDLKAVDYLLKPYSPERFVQACEKALEIYQWRQLEYRAKPTYFFLKSGYERIQITFETILYAKSVGNYVQFFLKGGRNVVSRLTMTEAEKLLMPPDFIRIHRQFIVARKQVTQVYTKAVLIGTMELPIGETYRQWIHEIFIK